MIWQGAGYSDLVQLNPVEGADPTEKTEIFIPFNQLRFNRAEEYVWGVNFMRYILANAESNYFSMVPKEENGFVSRFKQLVGIKGIKPPARLFISPYVAGKITDSPDLKGSAFYSRKRYARNMGLNVKYALIDSAGVRFKEPIEHLTYYGVYCGLREFNEGDQGLGFMLTGTVRQQEQENLKLTNNMNMQIVILTLILNHFGELYGLFCMSKMMVMHYISISKFLINPFVLDISFADKK